MNELKLKDFISLKQVVDSKQLFIQVFCSTYETEALQEVLSLLQDEFHLATIIGASTYEDISRGISYQKTITISFSIFNTVAIESFYLDSLNTQKVLSKLKKNTRACIFLSANLYEDVDSVFHALKKQNIALGGAVVSDNCKFEMSFIFYKGSFYTSGTLCIFFNSDTLNVYTCCNVNWKPIGCKLTVTKVDEYRVYELNNEPILDVFTYYFGKEILQDFPKSVISFPLMKGDNIAKCVVKLNKDKSITFSGDFQKGDEVYFSIPNEEKIRQDAYANIEELKWNSIEGSFIYASCSRKLILKEKFSEELNLFNQISTNAGMISFAQMTPTGMFTLAMSALCFSEQQPSRSLKKRKETPYDHLVKVTKYNKHEGEEPNYLYYMTRNKEIINLSDNLQWCKLSNMMFLNEDEVKLTSYELKLIQLFINNPNKIFTNEDILNHVWDYTTDVSQNNLRALFSRIKKKFGESIFTSIYGVGYRLKNFNH
jgi:hypothetical protein